MPDEGNRPNLLLVDADPRSLRVLEVSLKKAGYDVTTAADGNEALERFRSASPHLVLSDTHLPGMDGFELCRRIKEEPAWAKIPFLFLSSRNSIEDKIRGLELGVEDYLNKPVYIKEITTRVRMLLQRQQRMRLESQRETRTNFSGTLADVGIVDLVQTIDVNRKSGIIHILADDERRGAIYFRNGRVIDAEVGRLSGIEAVFRMFSWSDGKFEVEFKNVRRRDVVELSAQALLMEGMRRLDEWTRMLDGLPPLETVFEVDYRILADRLGDIPDEVNHMLRLFDGRRTFLQVIEDSDFTDLESVSVVARLFRAGIVYTGTNQRPTPAAHSMPTERLDRWLGDSWSVGDKTPGPQPTINSGNGAQDHSTARVTTLDSSGRLTYQTPVPVAPDEAPEDDDLRPITSPYGVPMIDDQPLAEDRARMRSAGTLASIDDDRTPSSGTTADYAAQVVDRPAGAQPQAPLPALHEEIGASKSPQMSNTLRMAGGRADNQGVRKTTTADSQPPENGMDSEESAAVTREAEAMSDENLPAVLGGTESLPGVVGGAAEAMQADQDSEEDEATEIERSSRAMPVEIGREGTSLHSVVEVPGTQDSRTDWDPEAASASASDGDDRDGDDDGAPDGGNHGDGGDGGDGGDDDDDGDENDADDDSDEDEARSRSSAEGVPAVNPRYKDSMADMSRADMLDELGVPPGRTAMRLAIGAAVGIGAAIAVWLGLRGEPAPHAPPPESEKPPTVARALPDAATTLAAVPQDAGSPSTLAREPKLDLPRVDLPGGARPSTESGDQDPAPTIAEKPAAIPDDKKPAVPVDQPIVTPRDKPVAVQQPAPTGSGSAAPTDLLDKCEKAHRRGRYAEILEACGAVLQVAPAQADIMIILANAELDRGQTQKAMTWAKMALKVDATQAEAYVFIGSAAQELGNKAEAKAAYARYLELAPTGKYARDLRIILQDL